MRETYFLTVFATNGFMKSRLSKPTAAKNGFIVNLETNFCHSPTNSLPPCCAKWGTNATQGW